MEENFKSKLNPIYHKLKLIWWLFFVEILILFIIVAVIKYFNLYGVPLLSNLKVFNNISLIIVVILLFSVIYLKRMYLNPEKLVDKARRQKSEPNRSVHNNFLAEFGSAGDMILKIVSILRKYYLLIWSIANFIVLLGFASFILSFITNTFITYGIVGLYSLVINFPGLSIIERCYYKIHSD